MSSILIRGAEAVMTGLPGGDARAGRSDIRIVAGRIAALGRIEPQPGDEVIDATGCVVYPAWVNTHHHLFQTVMKGTPESLNSSLREWLVQVPGRYRKEIDEQAWTGVKQAMVIHSGYTARPFAAMAEPARLSA